MTEKTEHSESKSEHKSENSAQQAHAALLHEAMDSGKKSAASAVTTTKGETSSGDTYVPPVQISESPFTQAETNRVIDQLATARFGLRLPEKDGVRTLSTGDFLVKDGDKLSIFTASGDKFTINADGTFTTKGTVESLNPTDLSKTPSYKIELSDGTTIDYHPGESLSISKGLQSDTFFIPKKEPIKYFPRGWMTDIEDPKFKDVKPIDPGFYIH